MKRMMLAAGVVAGVLGWAGIDVAAVWTEASTVGGAAVMGPPGICNEFDIGGARSLPWGKDQFTPAEGYDRSKLVEETAAVLKGERSVIARMETLRRSALYAERDKALAGRVLLRLAISAMASEAAGAGGAGDAESWFDAGYFVGCMDHMSEGPNDFGVAVAGGVDGYAFLAKGIAIAREKKDARVAEMEFGAAVMTHPVMRQMGIAAGAPKDAFEGHVKAAREGAAKGSLLEKNLDAFLLRYGKSAERK